MKSRKRLNHDGSTRLIIIQNNSGSFSAYTPSEAAQVINILKKQLWSGIPSDNQFK